MTDDASLVERFARTRGEADFRELYRRHTPAVFGLLRRLTRRREDAADLTQEMWIRAAARVGSFAGGSAVRTWLTGIALNCYREWRRARPPEVGPEATAGPGAAGDTVQRRVIVDGILDALTPEFRDVLVLHDVEGWTHAEIADALGIEVGTSKSRLSRAREQFRERWRGSTDRSRP